MSFLILYASNLDTAEIFPIPREPEIGAFESNPGEDLRRQSQSLNSSQVSLLTAPPIASATTAHNEPRHRLAAHIDYNNMLAALTRLLADMQVEDIESMIKESQRKSSFWASMGQKLTSDIINILVIWTETTKSPHEKEYDGPAVYFLGALVCLKLICTYFTQHKEHDRSAFEHSVKEVLNSAEALEDLTPLVANFKKKALAASIEKSPIVLDEFLESIFTRSPFHKDITRVSELHQSVEKVVSFIRQYDEFLTRNVIFEMSERNLWVKCKTSLQAWSSIMFLLSGLASLYGMINGAVFVFSVGYTVLSISNFINQTSEIAGTNILASGKQRIRYQAEQTHLRNWMKKCPQFTHLSGLSYMFDEDREQILLYKPPNYSIGRSVMNGLIYPFQKLHAFCTKKNTQDDATPAIVCTPITHPNIILLFLDTLKANRATSHEDTARNLEEIIQSFCAYKNGLPHEPANHEPFFHQKHEDEQSSDEITSFLDDLRKKNPTHTYSETTLHEILEKFSTYQSERH